MKQIFIVLLESLLLISACQVARNGFSAKEAEAVNLSKKDSLTINIHAVDLSEDMSRFSTQDDELMVLIYEMKDSTELDSLVFHKKMVLDNTNTSGQVWFSSNKNLIESTLLFMLIEQDEETPIEQIDLIISAHYQSIIHAFERRDYSGIKRVIGEEDILGIKKITKLSRETTVQFRFSGVHKLDKYDYLIRIGKF